MDKESFYMAMLYYFILDEESTNLIAQILYCYS